MDNKIVKGLVQILAAWAATSLAFFLMLVLVYRVPPQLTYDNVVASADYNEADQKGVILEDFTTMMSPSTVEIMLSMASHGGEDPVRDSMLGAHYINDDLGYFDALREGVDAEANRTYEWYWHGWMVLLRPLLIFMNYGGIKRLLWGITFCLIAALAAALSARMRGGLLFALAYCCAFGAVGINSVDILPYAFPTILSLSGALCVCRIMRPERDVAKRNNALYLLFFLLGALTCYLDFLVLPAITYIVPIVIYILFLRLDEGREFPRMLGSCVLLGLVWVCGYGGLWLAKWGIASLVLGENIFAVGMNQVLFRVGAEVVGKGVTEPLTEIRGYAVTPMNSVMLNIAALFAPITKYVFAFAAAATLIALIVAVIHRRYDYVILLLAAAILPYVWYAVTPNHSMMHRHFTYRLQTGTIFALLCMYAAVAIDCLPVGKGRKGVPQDVSEPSAEGGRHYAASEDNGSYDW